MEIESGLKNPVDSSAEEQSFLVPNKDDVSARKNLRTLARSKKEVHKNPLNGKDLSFLGDHVHDHETSSYKPDFQGIKVDYEKIGSIVIHEGDATLLSSDARVYNDMRKESAPSLKVHSLSFDLSEGTDNGVINIQTPNGQTKSFKNIITTPQQDLGGDRSISLAYWYGEDLDDGSTFNYIRGIDGNIHGSLVDITEGTVTQIHVDSVGKPVAVKRVSDEFPDEAEPIEAQESTDFNEMKENEATIREERRMLDEDIANSNGDGQVENDSRSVLDILVAYTSRAESDEGGRNNVLSRINLAIQEANAAYSLSGINLKLNLVDVYKSSIVEGGSSSSFLDRFRANSEARSKREQYGADVVALISGSNFSDCGIGYIGPFKDLMYSITRYDCATGYFSFAHEVGHNLGKILFF